MNNTITNRTNINYNYAAPNATAVSHTIVNTQSNTKDKNKRKKIIRLTSLGVVASVISLAVIANARAKKFVNKWLDNSSKKFSEEFRTQFNKATNKLSSYKKKKIIKSFEKDMEKNMKAEMSKSDKSKVIIENFNNFSKTNSNKFKPTSEAKFDGWDILNAAFWVDLLTDIF